MLEMFVEGLGASGDEQQGIRRGGGVQERMRRSEARSTAAAGSTSTPPALPTEPDMVPFSPSAPTSPLHRVPPVPQSTTTITLVNNCKNTVWPGITSTTGSTGFTLTPGSSKSLTTPSSWAGRIWARTYCNFSSSNSFSCITGDCSSGSVECSGKGPSPPVTLTEFALRESAGVDFYDVSLTGGYNLPVLVTPVGASGQNCNSPGCEVDVNGLCPLELQVTSSEADGGVVACQSACEAFRSPEYCCSGAYASPEKCKPTMYSKAFKNACPNAYSYAYDDSTSTFKCPSGAAYVLTFCPSPNTTRSTTLPIRGSVSKHAIIIGASSFAGMLVIACLLFCFFIRRRKTGGVLDHGDKSNSAGSDRTMKLLSIGFRTLRTATSNFSDENKIGEGGFGSVYKGILPDGREIAVKRLSSFSSHGIQELKTEVLLVAKLQHRNLVRLIGFCLEEEKVLVYEFLQNGSLDKILFGEEGKRYLNWELRYRIIVGIARGLQYLHEDSQMRIIHRDLKAANVLLDQDMNPKISDFGLAKLLPGSQSQGQASRIAGTYGYMAPEYVRNGHISTKCDVYSYAVLVLEIVAGRKNSSFAEATNLPNHAWRHWNNGRALEILDPILGEQLPMNEVLKCIQTGLLCAQESASDRPTMSEVVLMLGSDTIKKPAPKRPAFFSQATEGALLSQAINGSGGSQGEGGNRSLAQVSITELNPR